MSEQPPKNHPTRRDTLVLLGAAAATGLGGIPRPGWAGSHGAELVRAHGYSFYGDLAYPEGFEHFSYVNPDAPKGGQITLSNRGTFDGFNRWASKGRPESSSGCVAEAMFTDSLFEGVVPGDSITDAYCLIAEAVEYPKNKTECIFHMRKEARFSNGEPITAHDALFTHNLFLEQGIRSYARAVKERISGAEVIDDHTMRYTFVDGIPRRSLVSQVGGTPIFSKAWYEETGERLDEPSLLSPMASGPYVVGDYEINRYVVYERNPDYWGWHLPVNKGRHNFDRIRIEYFAEEAAEFEAFKAGIYNFRVEGSTKRWATGYDFPALDKGWVKKQVIPDGNPPNSAGVIFNTVKAPLDNRTVREALQLAFNFEWTRDSLQYGLTSQITSFVEGSEIAAMGPPEGKEKELLESLGDLVPAEMMTEDAVVPHTSDPGSTVDRRNKRRALRLLADAGWNVADDGKLRNAAGEVMTLQFMLSSSTSDTVEALVTTYVGTLNDYGIDASVEKIDTAQFTSRYLDKDYQLIYSNYFPFLQAGTGLRQMYGSETAAVSSYNRATLQSPLVDAIITKALDTTNREDEIAALRALDRALRYERVVALGGYVAENWIAAYDIFEHPENLPPYQVGYLDFWWFNQEKYEALKAAGALR
ncbi:extracellular solute-binding protein [Thalassococcus sp. CAU 1522]|uniref:Extracellular solute-binding protein n=1 Tax=Thalassococcus arenae TaxID=2851652 RepID=A0ABS6N8F7_9RHOB|nr:extracellular solute-binding protein [Thalassococcus arenae]MBV2360308.1 extracellular solute-binding protein [Thalassococcus arenae]